MNQVVHHDGTEVLMKSLLPMPYWLKANIANMRNMSGSAAQKLEIQIQNLADETFVSWDETLQSLVKTQFIFRVSISENRPFDVHHVHRFRNMYMFSMKTK